MHIVILLLLIFILLSKTTCCLSFRDFFVVITWLVKYGRDSKMWKDSLIEQIPANDLYFLLPRFALLAMQSCRVFNAETRAFGNMATTQPVTSFFQPV